MSGKNICIWKIEKPLTEIIPLLSYDYSDYINILRDLNIPDNDKKLIRKWQAVDTNGFNINNIAVEDIPLRFLKVIGHLETKAMSDSDILTEDGNRPLPKELRVNQTNSTVYFIDKNEYVYCIVCASKLLEPKIRNGLMESRTKDSRWGRIISKGIQEYTLDKSFYYWLLKNKGQVLQTNQKNVLIRDVRGFRIDADRDTPSYNGQGPSIDSEIPFKSLIGMDEKLVSLYLNILYNNVVYSFYLDYDSRLTIFKDECGEYATQTPRAIDIDEIIINLYFDIIPFLISKYNQALTSGWLNIERQFKKDVSIEIIRELMSIHGITKAEI